jgi:hypothetical protein
LQELIEAKMKGLPVNEPAATAPAPVVDLMAALKRSLAQESGATVSKSSRKAAADRRQRSMLLPLAGNSKQQGEAALVRTSTKRRQKA